MLGPSSTAAIVDNEALFRGALEGTQYDDLFTDAFAGDFGHLTREGAALLARQVAAVLAELRAEPDAAFPGNADPSP
jgi:hypothetical protein